MLSLNFASDPGLADIGRGSGLRRERHGEGESEHRRKDGTTFWIEYFTGLIIVDGREMVIGMDRDATARKLAEQALRASEERWHLAVAGSNEGVWDWNLEDDSIWFSPRWKSMLGFFDDELPSRREAWMDRIHPDGKIDDIGHRAIARVLEKVATLVDVPSAVIGAEIIRYRMSKRA